MTSCKTRKFNASDAKGSGLLGNDLVFQTLIQTPIGICVYETIYSRAELENFGSFDPKTGKIFPEKLDSFNSAARKVAKPITEMVISKTSFIESLVDGTARSRQKILGYSYGALMSGFLISGLAAAAGGVAIPVLGGVAIVSMTGGFATMLAGDMMPSSNSEGIKAEAQSRLALENASEEERAEFLVAVREAAKVAISNGVQCPSTIDTLEKRASFKTDADLSKVCSRSGGSFQLGDGCKCVDKNIVRGWRFMNPINDECKK